MAERYNVLLSQVTIHVHQRDVINDLCALHRQKRIQDANDFEWLKQVRQTAGCIYLCIYRYMYRYVYVSYPTTGTTCVCEFQLWFHVVES